MVMLRTEELVYPNLPLEDVDKFLDPGYEVVINDGQPQTIDNERPNLPLAFGEEFIPDEDPKLQKLNARQTIAVGMISRVVMPEVITKDSEPIIKTYPARIMIFKPGIIGRLIARVKNEEPMAKVNASVIIGKKDPGGANG